MLEQRLKKAFDPYFEAPLHVWQYFCSYCEEASFKKNEKIKTENTRAKYGYFLLSGAVGTFIWKKNSYGCLDFYFEDSFFADDYSLTTGLPSALEIIALEDCEVLQISRANIEILKRTRIGSRLFLAGEESDSAKRQEQRIELMTKTAEERYIDLINDRKDIMQRIPQKHIAAYLGITKESLSRMRRKLGESDLLS